MTEVSTLDNENRYAAPRTDVNRQSGSRRVSTRAKALGIAALVASICPLTLTAYLVNQELVDVVPVDSTFEFVAFDLDYVGGAAFSARQILVATAIASVLLVIGGVYLTFFRKR